MHGQQGGALSPCSRLSLAALYLQMKPGKKKYIPLEKMGMNFVESYGAQVDLQGRDVPPGQVGDFQCTWEP